MDSRLIEQVEVAGTRAKLEEIVNELQKELDKGEKNIDVTFYGVPNGAGPEEVKLHFSNDDMEADVNPDIDGSKIYIDFSEF